jgi:hypothetical protein
MVPLRLKDKAVGLIVRSFGNDRTGRRDEHILQSCLQLFLAISLWYPLGIVWGNSGSHGDNERLSRKIEGLVG